LSKLLLILLLLPIAVWAQQRTIKGRVLTQEGVPATGASIAVNGKHRAASDTSGHFTIQVAPAATVHIIAIATGYSPCDSLVALDASGIITVTLVLAPQVRELAAVNVTRQTGAAALRQSVQQVTVVDLKKYYNQSSGVVDVLNQTAGVRIRQDGGLGSRADLAINGVSGKQVKVFVDGIPASYFGAGAGLNVLPANIVDRLEIYKGVIPVYLGADALGGALNIVTRHQVPDYLEASYAVSSFNTHRATLNSLQHYKNGLFAAASVFYNHSDNNYPVTASVPNQYGNPVAQKVRQFHDGFSSYYASIESGWQYRRWADLASVTLNVSGTSQQVQHNIIMTQPYGHVTYGERNINGYVKYRKAALLPRLSLSFFGGVGTNRAHFVDTSLNAYSWDGKVVSRRTYGGEISTSRNNLVLHTFNTVNRLTLINDADSVSKVTFNVIATTYNRTGKDSIATAYFGQDYYSAPTRLFKTVAGLSYERKLLQGRLTSLSTAKYYLGNARGWVTDNNNFQSTSAQYNQWGAGQSFRYQLPAAMLVKLSYEYATRLPDEEEVFGDFALTKASPGLQPEKSHNLNAELQYNGKRVRANVTGFYRYIDNIIYLKASQFFAQYQNLLKARISGIEGEANWQPWTWLQLSANATYQNIINKSSAANAGTTDDRYYNLRLPNIPYLLSNGNMQYTRDNVFKKGNALSCWYGAGYVHWFYLYWSIDGRADQKATIPTQVVQQAGLSYAMNDSRYTASMEVQNLGNAKAYDNFSVQKPGRSIHLKLKIFLQ
jgi:outer membrane cobalamin receptor